MNTTTITYKAYEIVAKRGENRPCSVRVYDPRYPKDAALYVTSSIDGAKQWIDAYRAGQAWALNASADAEIGNAVAAGQW